MSTNGMINYHSSLTSRMNAFLSFRQHVTCLNRFNMYINNMQKQYDQNVYLRKFSKENLVELFLPAPHDNNWNHLYRAFMENIYNSKKVINDDEKLVVTSVQKDHLKRIVNAPKETEQYVHMWFTTENSKRKRKLDKDVILPENQKPIVPNDIKYHITVKKMKLEPEKPLNVSSEASNKSSEQIPPISGESSEQTPPISGESSKQTDEKPDEKPKITVYNLPVPPQTSDSDKPKEKQPVLAT